MKATIAGVRCCEGFKPWAEDKGKDQDLYIKRKKLALANGQATKEEYGVEEMEH